MAAIYQEAHQVAYYQGDTKKQMTLAMLVNVAILVSEHQNEELGITNELMQQHQVGWVVTQYQINVNRMPKVDETVTFATTATGYNKYFCYRDFWVTDQKGNRLVTIHSAWVMMSYKTRQMVAIIPEIVAKYKAPFMKGIKHFPRIHHVNADVAKRPYRVRYYDIDANQHVNNVHYFDWMFDHLGMPFLMAHDLAEINIRYEHELTVNDLAQSQFQQQGLISRHRISTGERQCAEAEVTWKNRH